MVNFYFTFKNRPRNDSFSSCSCFTSLNLLCTFLDTTFRNSKVTVWLAWLWPGLTGLTSHFCVVVRCPRRNSSERVWYWAFHYKVQSVDWEGGNHRVLFYLNREWHSFASFFPLQLHVNIHLYILHRVVSLLNLLNTWWYHTITSASNFQ